MGLQVDYKLSGLGWMQLGKLRGWFLTVGWAQNCSTCFLWGSILGSLITNQKIILKSSGASAIAQVHCTYQASA